MHLGWNKFGDRFNWRYIWDLPYIWSELKGLCREVKWAWQRVVKGYDDTIHWNGDSSIAIFIFNTIKQLKECHSGVPNKIVIQYKESIGIPLDDLDTKYDIDEADKFWQEVLEEGQELAWIVCNLDDICLDLDDPDIDPIIRRKYSEFGYTNLDKYERHAKFNETYIKLMYNWLSTWHETLWD